MVASLFNPVTLVKESKQYPSAPVMSVENMSLPDHFSYFSEALVFVSEMNRDLNVARKDFYKAVLESGGNDIVLQESFGGFFTKVREVIERFLKFIKSLFDRFVTAMNGFIKREKYLKNHKEDFSKFQNIHEFTISGFNYTINSHIPVIDALATFDTNFVYSLGDENSPVKIPQDKKEIKDSINMLTRDMEDGGWFDRFRGLVLDRKDDPIYKSDFADELFSEFRDGESIKSDIDVTTAYVIECYRRFDSYHSVERDIKKTKASIDSQYNDIKKKVEKMISVNYKDGQKVATIIDPDDNAAPGELDNNLVNDMNTFLKAKSNQIQEMANIHALAFAAKLDAVGDCFKQDKDTLYRALAKVQKPVKEA